MWIRAGQIHTVFETTQRGNPVDQRAPTPEPPLDHTSDEARGWKRLDLPAAPGTVPVETPYGAAAVVLPLGVPPMRAEEPGTTRSPREWGLEAMLSLRHALSETTLAPEDIVLLTIAARTKEDLKELLLGARAFFAPPRPAVQALVIALPPGPPVAIGAVAVARVRAAVGQSFAGMTIT